LVANSVGYSVDRWAEYLVELTAGKLAEKLDNKKVYSEVEKSAVNLVAQMVSELDFDLVE
jgi:hypothetical protein